MPNPKYIKGRKGEYNVREYFTQKNYWVMRSAGSKGPIDLAAIPPIVTEKLTICIQVKCGANPRVSSAERKALIRHCEVYGGMPCVAILQDRKPLRFEWL